MKKLKKVICVVCILIFILVSCKAETSVNLTASQIESVILTELSGEVGYCNVSEYYFNNFFSDIKGIKDYKIYVADESTNFDEIGIFEFDSVKSAEKAKSKIGAYLATSKKDFESGIIYNAEEYPKFQNAKVERYGNNLVYTILDSVLIDSISKSLKMNYKKGGIPPFIYFVIGLHILVVAPIFSNCFCAFFASSYSVNIPNTEGPLPLIIALIAP